MKEAEEKFRRCCHGVEFYHIRHRVIRGLKREHQASMHGHRVWTSCWLLMEYLSGLPLGRGLRVMDVGCGWGLGGIYCAKALGAEVVCVDADENVFPYLRAHAALNGVEVETRRCRHDQLTSADLAGVDLLIGSDICFWDELADELFDLVNLAAGGGVAQTLFADPGRGPFMRLSRRVATELGGQSFGFSVNRPHYIQGRIMKICR